MGTTTDKAYTAHTGGYNMKLTTKLIKDTYRIIMITNSAQKDVEVFCVAFVSYKDLSYNNLRN